MESGGVCFAIEGLRLEGVRMIRSGALATNNLIISLPFLALAGNENKRSLRRFRRRRRRDGE